MQTMVAGRTQMLPVYGAHGVKPIVDGFNTAYAEDARLRLAHQRRQRREHRDVAARRRKSPVQRSQARSTQRKSSCRMAISRSPPSKLITTPSVPPSAIASTGTGARRTDRRHRTLRQPGRECQRRRTCWCRNLFSPAMIALVQKQMSAAGNPRVAKIMSDIPDYHVSPVDAAKMANDAGVKFLVYTHHIPSIQVSNPAVLRRRRRCAAGRPVGGGLGTATASISRSARLK